MIAAWLKFLFWRPFELLCRRVPLIPLSLRSEEVAPRVQMISINNPATRLLSRLAGGFDYAVVYVVDGELLVDTGFAWAKRALKPFLLKGVASRLKYIVNTHPHEDHTGNNDLLRSLAPHAPIFAHASILSQIRFPQTPAWYRRFLFGPVVGSAVEAVPSVLRTTHYSFEVLSLPGHCPGHLCLWETDQRWLFSGDLYITPYLDSQLPDVNGPDWIASLSKAIALEPEMIFDAHGTVIRGSGACVEKLLQKKNFLEEVRSRVQIESQKGEATVEEITRRVFGRGDWTEDISFNEGRMALLTSYNFSRSNLVRTFLLNGPRS